MCDGEDGAQPAPGGFWRRPVVRMWHVPMEMVAFLMECLLRARHRARPVHSPADSSLSTYYMPGSMQGARDSRVNKNSIPALSEPVGSWPDGKAASLPWLPQWLTWCLQAVFELRQT